MCDAGERLLRIHELKTLKDYQKLSKHIKSHQNISKVIQKKDKSLLKS